MYWSEYSARCPLVPLAGVDEFFAAAFEIARQHSLKECCSMLTDRIAQSIGAVQGCGSRMPGRNLDDPLLGKHRPNETER